MTLQKLRRWLGFPLEDRYRVHIEQDIVQSSLRPGIFSALLILAFQAVMMVLSLLRKGGPFASLRRQGYWWLYVTLFSVTLLFLLLIVFLAVITPSASTITQMCQVYGNDSQYASAINVMTTLFSIVTMPLMVLLFQMIL